MADAKWKLSAPAIEAIVQGRHANPFEVLGLHQHSKTWLVRAFVPGALGVDVHTLDGKTVGALEQRHAAGFFEGAVKLKSRQPLRLNCSNEGGAWTVTDAYTFGPVLGPMDDHFIGEGNHLRMHDKMGAHPMHHEGCDGVHFAVWAPNAQRVSVIGDFNNNVRWDKPRTRRFGSMIDGYREAGLRSLYHEKSGEAFGQESVPTHWWRDRKVDGPTYHIDYAFVPQHWLPVAEISVGTFEQSVTNGGSDHASLVVTLDQRSDIDRRRTEGMP